MTDAASPDYPYTQTITLRWKDNDAYGHVNNVEYYSFFDTVINEYLITAGGLNLDRSPAIGLCAESRCAFKAAISYPGAIRGGLRVGHLGTSSVRYEIALADAADARPLAEGWFVHVFVDRETRRPMPIPDGLRAALERLA